MDDNDIIKGLENWLVKDLIVIWCNDKDNNLMPVTVKDILKVINNLKAENERLKDPSEIQVEVSKKLENAIKAEAVKEFAEKVKYFCADSVVFDDWDEECRLIEFIDDLVKETEA